MARMPAELVERDFSEPHQRHAGLDRPEIDEQYNEDRLRAAVLTGGPAGAPPTRELAVAGYVPAIRGILGVVVLPAHRRAPAGSARKTSSVDSQTPSTKGSDTARSARPARDWATSTSGSLHGRSRGQQ